MDPLPLPELAAIHTCPRDGLPSEGTCLRCGGFLCARCRRWQAEQALCVDCRERLGNRPSAQARTALMLATVGIGTLLPGAVAIVLGHRELKRIARCEASDAGENHARMARGLGILEVLILAGVVVLLAST